MEYPIFSKLFSFILPRQLREQAMKSLALDLLIIKDLLQISQITSIWFLLLHSLAWSQQQNLALLVILLNGLSVDLLQKAQLMYCLFSLARVLQTGEQNLLSGLRGRNSSSQN
jgi:hypothetical protein